MADASLAARLLKSGEYVGADAHFEKANPPSSNPTSTRADRTFCPVVKPETLRVNRRAMSVN